MLFWLYSGVYLWKVSPPSRSLDPRRSLFSACDKPFFPRGMQTGRRRVGGERTAPRPLVGEVTEVWQQ